MASDKVYGGRVSTVAGILILSLMLQSSSREFSSTHAFTVIPENVSKPITTNEEFSQQQLALFSNNQADQNDSNPIPEILSEDNEKLKFLTEHNNDDVRNTFMTIPKNISKIYEDMKKMYGIIMEIHKDIFNTEYNSNKQLSSFPSKELISKKQSFLSMQNEFDQNLKPFKKRQLNIEKRLLTLLDENEKIIKMQNELRRKQQNITEKQKGITAQFKEYDQNLKSFKTTQFNVKKRLLTLIDENEKIIKMQNELRRKEENLNNEQKMLQYR